MHRSRVAPVTVVAAGLLVIASLAGLAASDQADDATTPQDILDRVAKLEQRVAELEGHVAELEARPPIVQLDGTQALPSPPPAPYGMIDPPSPHYRPALPRGTYQGEINGMPYYVIPLQHSMAAAPSSQE